MQFGDNNMQLRRIGKSTHGLHLIVQGVSCAFFHIGCDCFSDSPTVD